MHQREILSNHKARICVFDNIARVGLLEFVSNQSASQKTVAEVKTKCNTVRQFVDRDRQISFERFVFTNQFKQTSEYPKPYMWLFSGMRLQTQ